MQGMHAIRPHQPVQIARNSAKQTRSVCAVCRSFGQQRDDALRLPGGEYWWIHNRNKNIEVIYGDEFIIERPRVGGEGLVPAMPVSVQAYRHTTIGLTPEAQRAALSIFGSSTLFPWTKEPANGLAEVEKKEENEETSNDNNTNKEYRRYAAIPEFTSGSTALAPPVGRATRMGSQAENGPIHPRRTARVSFSCNICGHRNCNRPVNPRAWKTGSVFIKCSECLVVHKIKDNLKVRGSTRLL